MSVCEMSVALFALFVAVTIMYTHKIVQREE